MKKILLPLTLALLLFAVPAFALVSPTADFYVYDGAQVLSEATEGMIVFSNDLLHADSGAQFVVVTLATTGNQAIEDYAYELFNDWRIGSSIEQNGFLMLLAIDDADYYFLPGTGVDIEMSWGKIKPIVDEYLEPRFAAGKYDAGVYDVFEQLFQKLAGLYGSAATTAQGARNYEAYAADAAAYANPGRGGSGGGVQPSEQERNQPMWALAWIVIGIFLFSLIRRRVGPLGGLFWFLGSLHRPRHNHFHAHRPRHSSFHNRSSRSGGFGSMRSGSRTGGFGGSRSSGSRSSGRSGGLGGGRSGGGGGSRGGGGGRGR
ncbi:MAG: TPM domain-containing protein [Christensenellales bacterium]|jgi:uncharacterized protein